MPYFGREGKGVVPSWHGCPLCPVLAGYLSTTRGALRGCAVMACKLRNAGVFFAVGLVAVLALTACGGGGGSSNGSDGGSVSIEVSGAPEVVFDWTTDRCEVDDYPDLPARAFRDAAGEINLVTGLPTRIYRWTGPDFDSLTRDCSSAVLVSAEDPDPSVYDFQEWMGALYSTDGMTVHGLVHMEYHGWEAGRWLGRFGFSPAQDRNEWRYRYDEGSGLVDMSFNATDLRWEAGRPHDFCSIERTLAHPDVGCDAVRTWVSPVDATVNITGEVEDLNHSCGDGITFEIRHGSTVLETITLANGDPPEPFDVSQAVAEGDELHFVVKPGAGGNADCDSTGFDPRIVVGEDPCPSDTRGGERCQLAAVTHVRSDDGGATYIHPDAPPDHLVATAPTRYVTDGGLFGMRAPSNIVRHPDDGFFYALAIRFRAPADDSVNEQGACVIRTDTLGDPDSWRAWDGSGFNMRFANPYAETVSMPEQHRCEIVLVGSMARSLTYNTEIDKFVVVGSRVAGGEGPGFYFSVSDDVVDWTEPKLLMEADLRQSAADGEPFVAYPSIIDHDDDTRNFERPDGEAFLYYTRFNNTLDPAITLSPNKDTDLLRVPITIATE